jgi:hypothetical protein
MAESCNGINMNDLAEILFIKNVDNDSITISISGNGLKNTKDIFSFYLNIMIKGLVILYGVDNQLIVKDITMDQFNVIKAKMRCANIECHLEVIPLDTLNETEEQEEQEQEEENMKLIDYHFDLQLPEYMYRIRFDTKYNF